MYTSTRTWDDNLVSQKKKRNIMKYMSIQDVNFWEVAQAHDLTATE